MTALVRNSSTITAKWSPGQLGLIRETIAKKLTNRLFDQFMESAARLNLDPLKKQIVPIVFRKKEDDGSGKKKVWTPYLTLITTIDGYRAIGERTGNYRPDERTPRWITDEAAKNPDTNPLGLVSCEVSVFKYAHGAWHEHPAIAFWDEYAPLKTLGGGGDDPDPDAPPATPGKTILDPFTQWPKRPRGQLAKVAEALALRRAWPEDFSGVYVEEEMDRARVIEGEYTDLTPSEQAETAAIENRLDAVRAKDSIIIDWLEQGGGTLTPVPLGQLADKCFAFIKAHAEEPSLLGMFQERNRHALREFWAKAPGDALAVKAAFEEAITKAKVPA